MEIGELNQKFLFFAFIFFKESVYWHTIEFKLPYFCKKSTSCYHVPLSKHIYSSVSGSVILFHLVSAHSLPWISLPVTWGPHTLFLTP